MDEGAASAPPVAHVRPVRSFVRREGRMTEAQKRALDELWPRFGVPDPAAPLDSMALFGREAPLTVEIGFGDGDHLLGRAQQEPARNFLGVEVHRPGIGRLLLRAQAVGLRNLRVAAHDAVEVLRDAIRPGQVDELLIYFPDPWPKKRHHKRRLVQPAFAALAAARLAPGGMLRLATDWAPYAEHMRAVLDAEPALQNAAAGFSDRGARPATKFERRGVRLGHAVFDLAYRRVG
ncbi:MAG TPA: tRNA (guanosine(46)-N7)-methyltransferase TrmB [Candidatus Binatia bacterium]|nr:tRNA (guanosine(46)-N7)-methyltransferase TrmB [Candidatus Binatia bacterium]